MKVTILNDVCATAKDYEYLKRSAAAHTGRTAA